MAHVGPCAPYRTLSDFCAERWHRSLSIRPCACSIVVMVDDEDEEAGRRLDAFMDGIGDCLENPRRRASFAVYFLGLMGDGARKSMEPIAARACGDPAQSDSVHQKLGHFITDSQWNDHAVRAVAAKEALEAMTARQAVVAWIFDDTGFLKQGSHSVGVQRQYTGSAGKVTNCQIGVSLSISTSSWHVPCDFELYLPHCWADDPKRRREGRIPDDVEFKTKPQLALQMLERAVAQGYPRGVVLGDTAYGDAVYFRDRVTELGLQYALGINGTALVRRIDAQGRHNGPVTHVKDLAERLEVRRVTWRDGTMKRLTARFSFCRVVPAYDDQSAPVSDRDVVWLVVEYRDDTGEIKYYLASFPEDATKKHMVRVIKERYRTEQVYRELKGELGLDHFEGRRFTGWHHHVTVALCCYAFVVAERARAFPPSGGRPRIPLSLLRPT
jgi:SRSO17 transposase